MKAQLFPDIFDAYGSVQEYNKHAATRPTILELQHLPYDIPELHKILSLIWSPDCEAIKL